MVQAFYLKAKTLGMIETQKKFSVEVCGGEKVELKTDVAVIS